MKLNIKLSPQRISWISLVLSVLTFFMLRINFVYGMVWLLIILIVDMGDGIIFKRKRLSKIDGLAIEVSHRLSEFLIFYPNKIWILLATFNVYLTIASLKNRKIVPLPLRHIFLLLLIAKFLDFLPSNLFFLASLA